MPASLDHSDRILLDMLQKDCTTPIGVLADECGLSVASVQRRLKRLRQEGIVEREVAVLNPAALGQEMTFIIMVEMERERLDQLQAFRRKAAADPNVQQCYYVTGDADFVLICTAPDMKAFELLTQRLFFEDENVRRFRTSVTMNRTKIGLTVPVFD